MLRLSLVLFAATSLGFLSSLGWTLYLALR